MELRKFSHYLRYPIELRKFTKFLRAPQIVRRVYEKPITRYVLGGVIFVGGVNRLITYYASPETESFEKEDWPSESDRMKTFKKIAWAYDRRVAMDEWITGIEKWRRQLVSRARGLTLEVSCGTGRNLKYYPKGCDVVLTDKSFDMMKVIRSKPVSKKPIFKAMRQMDTIDLKFPDEYFDTVIDTFGICSFENPEIALQEMVRVCKPGGQILLLEHGASSWSIMKQFQDQKLARHLKIWGCYPNREILKLIEKLPEGLVTTTEIRRKHFGTSYFIHLHKAGDKPNWSHPAPFYKNIQKNRPSLIFTGLIVDYF